MHKTYKKLSFFIFLFFIMTALISASTLWLRDPKVDLSMYQDVIPSYKLKIKELRTATQLIQNPLYRFRQQEGLKRLEALTKDSTPIHLAAKKTLYYFYAEPERWQCPTTKKGKPQLSCKAYQTPLNKTQSKKAFYWAKTLKGREQITALTHLLRDWRVQPVATEADRIALILAIEKDTPSATAMNAAIALAEHHLDKRYFQNNMIEEATLWLHQAAAIKKKL